MLPVQGSLPWKSKGDHCFPGRTFLNPTATFFPQHQLWRGWWAFVCIFGWVGSWLEGSSSLVLGLTSPHPTVPTEPLRSAPPTSWVLSRHRPTDLVHSPAIVEDWRGQTQTEPGARSWPWLDIHGGNGPSPDFNARNMSLQSPGIFSIQSKNLTEQHL